MVIHIMFLPWKYRAILLLDCNQGGNCMISSIIRGVVHVGNRNISISGFYKKQISVIEEFIKQHGNEHIYHTGFIRGVKDTLYVQVLDKKHMNDFPKTFKYKNTTYTVKVELTGGRRPL